MRALMRPCNSSVLMSLQSIVLLPVQFSSTKGGLSHFVVPTRHRAWKVANVHSDSDRHIPEWPFDSPPWFDDSSAGDGGKSIGTRAT